MLKKRRKGNGGVNHDVSLRCVSSGVIAFRVLDGSGLKVTEILLRRDADPFLLLLTPSLIWVVFNAILILPNVIFLMYVICIPDFRSQQGIFMQFSW